MIVFTMLFPNLYEPRVVRFVVVEQSTVKLKQTLRSLLFFPFLFFCLKIAYTLLNSLNLTIKSAEDLRFALKQCIPHRCRLSLLFIVPGVFGFRISVDRMDAGPCIYGGCYRALK